jgi:predicted chitinase
MKLYQGVVENRLDPLRLGRCQVRVMGLHTHDKNQLPIDDLPWAYPMQSITSAAMSGIGHAPVGPVEGTWVVIMFTDDDEQFPIMMGTLGGISQPETAVDQDPPGMILKDESGAETSTTPVEVVSSSGSGTPVQTTASEPSSLTPQQQAQNVVQPGTNPTPAATPAAAPASGTPQTVTTDIPTAPPPEFKTLIPQRTAAIKALIAAMDKQGVKSREARCAILAMAGGESGYIPADEGYNYSEDALRNIFSSTFGKFSKGKNEGVIKEYVRCTKTKTVAQFFDFVYAPQNNGSGLGNTQPGDGGKFYGRGLTGITGRYAYTTYGNMIGVDLVNNPGLLSTDLSVSAAASVAMIIDNTKKKFPKSVDTAHPQYFYDVKKAQGKDANSEGAARRLRYYEYFYGTKVSSTFTEDKSAAPPPPSTDSTASSQPTSNGGTTAGPSSTNAGPNGFKDPNNKYPLSSHTKEADTNRLARGQSSGTVDAKKELTRKTGIPTSNSTDTLDEPKSSFAARYPYNHVTETESGHIREMDDTPGHERIHELHRSGTFYEIDPNGTKVTHIVGDSYEILDRNGVIYISGTCNITIGGAANILCQNDADIQVIGNLNTVVGGDYTLGIAGNMTTVVGGAYQLQSGSDMTQQTSGSMHQISVGNTNHYSVGTMNLKASGNVNIDGVRVDINDGKAAGATSINLTAPPAGVVNTQVFEKLEAPPAGGEEQFLIETEDEWASPAGQAAKAENEKQYGKETPATQEEAAPASGGTQNNTVASCQVIYGMQDFTNDFRLSTNFTLGMLIDGGVNGHNKLRDQNGLTKQQIVCNLSQLCQNIYEPLLAVLPGGIGGYGKQWKINSGYRISSNVPKGGVSKSDHMLGRATDMTLLPYGPNKAKLNFDFATQIEKILPYDQIIMEYMPGGSNWIHIGYRGVKEGDTAGGGVNRKMAFTMYNGDTIKRDGFLLK